MGKRITLNRKQVGMLIRESYSRLNESPEGDGWQNVGTARISPFMSAVFYCDKEGCRMAVELLPDYLGTKRFAGHEPDDIYYYDGKTGKWSSDTIFDRIGGPNGRAALMAITDKIDSWCRSRQNRTDSLK